MENALCMRIQVVGFGNVCKGLIALIDEKKEILSSLGVSLNVVSVSDSRGTAYEKRGLDLGDVLRRKENGWEGSSLTLRVTRRSVRSGIWRRTWLLSLRLPLLLENRGCLILKLRSGRRRALLRLIKVLLWLRSKT